MIFYNVDHIDMAELVSLSRDASSQFLEGAAALWEMFAHMERKNWKAAADAGQRARSRFEKAAPEFRRISDVLKGNNWIGHELRNVDLKLAATAVHLDPNSVVLRKLNSEIVRGNIHVAFEQCANQTVMLSDESARLASRIMRTDIGEQLKYEDAHKLISHWMPLIIQGQHISAAFLLAATAGAAI